MNIKRVLLATALIGLAFMAFFAHYVYKAMFMENTAFANNEAFIYIGSDASYNDVRAQLEPLLLDLDSFDALAQKKKYTTNIKAGKYAIRKGMNNNEIINSIRSRNIPVKVAFNNQHSLEALAGRIASQIEADSITLLTAMKDTSFLEAEGLTEETALGIYLPNSYEFFWNTSGESFRNRMLKEYTSFWSTQKLNRLKELDLSKEEVMILAAIVHEESKQAVEQPRIAGVYMNRLKYGWPLQADPTLKYAAYQLPEYQNTVIKRVLNKHKEINSPYNTYQNKGLPPGLIAMPDLSAVNAVLNYEKHNYFYFAADAGNPGFHKFANSLNEHNRNARDYQLYLNTQGIRK
ncbi:MAG: endolytic transglycosylase MltG [bacterium]